MKTNAGKLATLALLGSVALALSATSATAGIAKNAPGHASTFLLSAGMRTSSSEGALSAKPVSMGVLAGSCSGFLATAVGAGFRTGGVTAAVFAGGFAGNGGAAGSLPYFEGATGGSLFWPCGAACA